MGLSNAYVGSVENYTDRAKFSPQWLHKWANGEGLAFADEEAGELSPLLLGREDAAQLEGATLNTLIYDLMDETACLGRMLEQDEDEHIARNPDTIVIDE